MALVFFMALMAFFSGLQADCADEGRLCLKYNGGSNPGNLCTTVCQLCVHTTVENDASVCDNLSVSEVQQCTNSIAGNTDDFIFKCNNETSNNINLVCDKHLDKWYYLYNASQGQTTVNVKIYLKNNLSLVALCLKNNLATSPTIDLSSSICTGTNEIFESNNSACTNYFGTTSSTTIVCNSSGVWQLDSNEFQPVNWYLDQADNGCTIPAADFKLKTDLNDIGLTKYPKGLTSEFQCSKLRQTSDRGISITSGLCDTGATDDLTLTPNIPMNDIICSDCNQTDLVRYLNARNILPKTLDCINNNNDEICELRCAKDHYWHHHVTGIPNFTRKLKCLQDDTFTTLKFLKVIIEPLSGIPTYTDQFTDQNFICDDRTGNCIKADLDISYLKKSLADIAAGCQRAKYRNNYEACEI